MLEASWGKFSVAVVLIGVRCVFFFSCSDFFFFFFFLREVYYPLWS